MADSGVMNFKTKTVLVFLTCLLLQYVQVTENVGVGIGLAVSPLLVKKAIIGLAISKPAVVKKGLIVGGNTVIFGKGQSMMALGGSTAIAKGVVTKKMTPNVKAIGKAVIKAGSVAVRVPILVGGKLKSGTESLSKAAVKIAGNIIAAKSNIAVGVRAAFGRRLPFGQLGSEKAIGKRSNSIATGSESHDLVSRRLDLIREHRRDISETKYLLVGHYRAALSTSVTGSLSAAVSAVKKTFSQGKAEKVKSVGSATGILGTIQHTFSTINQPNVVVEEKDFSVKKPIVPEVTKEVEPPLSAPNSDMQEGVEPLESEDFIQTDSGVEEPIDSNRVGQS